MNVRATSLSSMSNTFTVRPKVSIRVARVLMISYFRTSDEAREVEPTVSNELSPFTQDEDQSADKREVEGSEVTLLLFSQGDALLAVEAQRVDSIIPWRAPAPLPMASAAVAGVVQDRGRVIAVRRLTVEGATPQRIIVCTTDEGLIGIPATTTRAIGPVVLRPSLVFGAPTDSSEGVLTVLDPAAIAAELIGGA